MTEDDGYETIVPDLNTPEVTQADRNAAAEWHHAYAMTVCGGKGDAPDLAELLARHRQQAIAQHEGGRGEPFMPVVELSDDMLMDTGSEKVTWGELRARLTSTPATRPAALAGDRDIYEVANQLAGYIGPDTSDELTAFLWRESQHAAKLADRITQQAEEVRDLNKRLAVANATRMDADEEVARLREAAIGSTAGLSAALSILQRANSQHLEPCKAVASDKMFAQMMTDYQKRLDASRAALNEEAGNAKG